MRSAKVRPTVWHLYSESLRAVLLSIGPFVFYFYKNEATYYTYATICSQAAIWMINMAFSQILAIHLQGWRTQPLKRSIGQKSFGQFIEHNVIAHNLADRACSNSLNVQQALPLKLLRSFSSFTDSRSGIYPSDALPRSPPVSILWRRFLRDKRPMIESYLKSYLNRFKVEGLSIQHSQQHSQWGSKGNACHKNTWA